MVTHIFKMVTMPEGFEPWSGSVRPKTAQPLVRSQLGQVLLALFFRAELIDGIHDQRTLHRGGGTHARIAAFHFPHDQAVRNIVQATAAVLCRQGRAKGTDLAEFTYNLIGKCACWPEVFDMGDMSRFTNSDIWTNGSVYALRLTDHQWRRNPDDRKDPASAIFCFLRELLRCWP